MTIKTNRDVLKAKLMEHFDNMDRDDLIDLWNEHTEDRYIDTIEDIRDLDDYYESAFGSDVTELLNAVYRGKTIDNWLHAEYFTVTVNGELIFLQDYDDAAGPYDAMILAYELLEAGDSLVDEIRDDLIAEAHADAESWDDGDDASPAAYLCALNALMPTTPDAANNMADDYAAWAASRTLTAGETDSFRSFFRDVAKRTGTRNKFAAMGII